MDRTLVLNMQLAIARGHRVEVSERVVDGGETAVLSILDLDTGIRYRRAEPLRGELVRWTGRILECTVVMGGAGTHTELVLAPEASGGTGARTALHEADAAAVAAKAEAERWGGTDRAPQEPVDRIW